MDENWRDVLPDEIKGNEALANFADIPQLAQGFIDAKAYQGSSIKIPGDDAGDDAKKEFHTRMLDKVPALMLKPNMEDKTQSVDFYRSLGMPELAEGYELPEVQLPEGIELQPGRNEQFRSIAHKHGLTAAQFTGIMTDITSSDIEVAQATLKGREGNIAAVKEKFGHAYDDNMAKINTMLDKTGAPDALVKGVKGGEVGPEVAEWLYRFAKQMGGEGSDFADLEKDQNRSSTMTPDEARAAIHEINNNKTHAYWVGTGAEKKAATDRMLMLMKFANPGAATEMQRA